MINIGGLNPQQVGVIQRENRHNGNEIIKEIIEDNFLVLSKDARHIIG